MIKEISSDQGGSADPCLAQGFLTECDKEQAVGMASWSLANRHMEYGLQGLWNCCSDALRPALRAV